MRPDFVQSESIALQVSLPILLAHRLQALLIWRLGYATFGYYCGHELVWSDIECRIEHRNAIRNDSNAPNVRHFNGVSLLDWNVGTVGNLQIQGRDRSGNVEWDLVLLRQHSQRIGSNLVRHVAVGSNPVRADNDGVNQSLPHERAGHIVGNDPNINVILPQLPCGQPRALQERPCFVGEDAQPLPIFNGSTNDAERGSISGRRQRARVAVGQNGSRIRQQVLAKAAQTFVVFDVLGLNGERFLDEPVRDGAALGAAGGNLVE